MSPRSLVRFLACLALSLAIAGEGTPQAQPQAGGSSPQGSATIRVRIRDVIGWPQVALVRRALLAAEAGEADLVIVDLDTPGGRLDATHELIALLQNLRRGRNKVRTVAFVNPQAYSAGAIIALACGRIYLTETGVIGDAYPIQVDPLGQPRELPEGVKEKQLSALRGEMRKLAAAFPPERREAVAVLAEGMVDPSLEIRQVRVVDADGVASIRVLSRQQEEVEIEKGHQVTPLASVASSRQLVTLTAEQAMQYGLAEGIVAGWDDLIKLFGVDPGGWREMELSGTERFADFLERISFFLLVGGVLAGLVAFKMPGFGVPEVLSLTCFFLLFLGHYYTGLSDWMEPLLFLAGVVLIGLELFVIPGTFVAGGLGIGLALVGLVLSFQGFILPEDELQGLVLEENLRSFLIAAFCVLAGAWLIWRLLPGLPLFHKAILVSSGGEGSATGGAEAPALRGMGRALVGRRGVAKTPLRPAGRIELDGEPLDAQTEGEYLEPGTPVEITRCDSNRVVVKAVAEGQIPT